MMFSTTSLLTLTLFAAVAAQAQTRKKTQNFTVSRIFPVPADKLWKAVGEDYGDIAKSHPTIIESAYVNGSLKGEEGAERVCYFNESHTQFLKEKMIDYSPGDMRFINTIYQTGKFPLDTDVSQAVFQVEDLGDGKSRLIFDMAYRTRPAFMGSLMKGKFKKLIQDYFLALEYYLKTGEEVNKENFKQIKKESKG